MGYDAPLSYAMCGPRRHREHVPRARGCPDQGPRITHPCCRTAPTDPAGARRTPAKEPGRAENGKRRGNRLGPFDGVAPCQGGSEQRPDFDVDSPPGLAVAETQRERSGLRTSPKTPRRAECGARCRRRVTQPFQTQSCKTTPAPSRGPDPRLHGFC